MSVLSLTADQARIRRQAVALILVASAFIALSTLCAKLVQTDLLGPALPPWVATAGRFGFAFLLYATVTAIARPRLERPHWGLHILRTTMGGIGVTLMFAAIAVIPLADATAISFLNPVFAMLFAIAFLGERVGPWRWVAAGLSLTGAVILLRPGAGAVQVGALLALGAALVLGLEVTVMKRLSALERPLQILLVNNGIGAAIFVTLAAAAWQPPTGAQWLALAGVGLAMGTAQACFINALRMADTSFVVPFSYAVLIFAAFWDAVVYGILPDWVSYTGIATILAGGVLLAWREARASS